MSPLKPIPRLAIDSCEALFEKLKWDHAQLKKEWDSSYCTFNFVVTAYHLYQDWINSAGTDEQKSRKTMLPSNGVLLFEVWRDITNATKHWELNERSQKQQVVDGISTPIVHDWHAFLVTGPVSYVQVGGTRLSMSGLVEVTMLCFKWLIEGERALALTDLERELNLLFRPFKP